jgi:drug/metabolite transporter (DMT)-like permease
MSRVAILQFAGVALAWGLLFVLIEVVGDELSPVALTCARAWLAAAVLVPLAWRRGSLRRLRSRRSSLALLALLDVTLPLVLLSVGQRSVSAGLAGMLVATTPIFVVALAPAAGVAGRPRPLQLAGLATGIAGVALVLGVQVGGDGETLAGAALVLGAALMYALAQLLYKRRFTAEDPLAVSAWVMVLCAVALTVPALLSAPAAVPSAGALAAVAAMGLGCGALAYVLYYGLTARVGPSRSSLVSYVAPAVAVVLGVVFLDERFGPGTAAGLALVLGGTWMASGAAAAAVSARRGR